MDAIYKDGCKAKIGDAVLGWGEHFKRPIAGTVVNVGIGIEENIQVAFLRPATCTVPAPNDARGNSLPTKHRIEQSGQAVVVVESFPLVLCLEIGAAKDFTRIDFVA
jgi:hypothetical protein